MARDGECTFTFAYVRLGAKVRAVVKIYVLEDGANGNSEHLLYSGESDDVIVKPGDNKITVLLSPPHTVTFNTDDGTRINPQTVEFGKKAVRPVDPTKEGFAFAGWYVDEEFRTAFDFNTVITEDTTLYAKWATVYQVAIDSNITNGTITADKSTAMQGETVTLTISASSGYEFNTLSVNNAEGVIISTTAITSGRTYTFTMPEGNVIVSATFTFQGTSYTVLPPGTDGTAGTEWTYVLFGDWPQTIKAPDVEVDEEDNTTMGVFTYYKGSDGAWYVKCTERAYVSSITYSDGTTVAGESANSTKYFKVEPIKWRVVSENYGGKRLLLAEKALATQKYRNGTSDEYKIYRDSDIRNWLNNDFFNSAFTAAEKNMIAVTEVDNSARSTNPDFDANYFNGGINNYATENTYDKVFLLSVQEATKEDFGFRAPPYADSAKIRPYTDYTLANHLLINSGSSQLTLRSASWWLRTPEHISRNAQDYPYTRSRCVSYTGEFSSICRQEVNTTYGVVPALCVE